MRAIGIFFLAVLCSLSTAGTTFAGHNQPHILATGADSNGYVSVKFSPTGDLWVSEGFREELQRMDPDTGEILEVISDGVRGAADLDFASDGTMYWVNAWIGEIFKMEPGQAPVMIAEFGHMIDGVSVNAEDRVFTASFLSPIDAVWELDPEGIAPPEIVADVGGFDAFDFGPDGYLYGPDFQYGTGNIIRVDIETGDYGVIAGGFVNPSSLRFTPNGELYVLDSGAAQVVEVDPYTGDKALVAEIAPMADNFDISPEGEIFIAFITDAAVGKVLPGGELTYLTKPGFATPGSIAFTTDERGRETMYVSDSFSYRQIDHHSGKLVDTVYPGAAIPASTLASDGANLILTYYVFNLLQIIDPVTLQIKGFFFDFNLPINTVAFGNDLAVAELATGNVVRASDRAVLISGLELPAGMAADGDNLWVGDWDTGTIYKAVEDGVILDPPTVVAAGLKQPEGMTVDDDGCLLVVETGEKRLIRIEQDGWIETIADDLAVGLPASPGVIPFNFALSGVAVSKNGQIYVAGDIDNVIYRIDGYNGHR
jgi:sugar lactone lactonase YvrE